MHHPPAHKEFTFQASYLIMCDQKPLQASSELHTVFTLMKQTVHKVISYNTVQQWRENLDCVVPCHQLLVYTNPGV